MCGHGGCHCGHGCGCEDHGPHHGGRCHHEERPLGFQRRFVGRAERIQELEAYLSELRAEIAAVEEYLAGLKAAA